MDSTILVRQLVWQNGLYLGLLRSAAVVLASTTADDESVNICEKLVAEILATLKASLPPFAQEAKHEAVS